MLKIYKTFNGEYISENNLITMADDEFLKRLSDYYDKWETDGLSDLELMDYKNMIECLIKNNYFDTVGYIDWENELKEVKVLLKARIKEGFY